MRWGFPAYRITGLGRMPFIVEEHEVDINRDKYSGTSVGGGVSYTSSVLGCGTDN
jgi:hypothetical protein